MPDEKPYKYENLPIPTYEEATSSRVATPTESRNENSNDEERRGLLDSGPRIPVPTRRQGYRPPTVESDDESDDSLDALDGLPEDEHAHTAEDAEVRREMEEMEIMDPPAERSRWSKRISSISQTLHLSRIPWPKWKLRLPKLEGHHLIIIGRIVAVCIVMGLAYLLFISDLFNIASRTVGAGLYDPEDIRVYMQKTIDPKLIRENLEHITAFDHIAGTEGDYALSNWVQKRFHDAGLEDITRDQYDVYLNYPKPDGRAVELLNDDGTPRWTAKLEEAELYPGQNRSQALAFHGYSKSGDVKGPLIYANYGSREDFKKLADAGIITKGAIAIVKYYGTQGDRGLKIKAAEQAGFVGCILYSDPQEDGFINGKPWPEGRFMPEDGLQRGAVNLMSMSLGDPLTPGWPSVPGAKRLSKENNPGLVNIPSLPLSWGNAKVLLQSLKGHGVAVPDEWKGGVPDVEWWTGNKSSPVVRLKNEQEEIEEQPIWNIMGRINGVEQGEKSVIIGSHRDAWTFGAADPGSGTAVLLEVVRIFGELKRHGWRPLRTIEFASWDGEEYNMLGSTEYVENNIDKLRSDGFVYLNVDVAVTGSDFSASGSPVFSQALHRVLSRVFDTARNATLQELWDQSNTHLGGPGAGSDHVAFQDLAGVSALHFGFSGDPFPYHSVYDSFEWMDKFGDPGFQYHQLMAEVWTLLVLEYCDRPVVPFSIKSFAESVDKWVNEVDQWAIKNGANQKGKKRWDAGPLKAAAAQLLIDAQKFENWEVNWESMLYGMSGFETGAMSAHRIHHNIRAGSFEKLLLDLEEGGGIPGREQFKHVLFAPQLWSGYDEAFFPAVRDAIAEDDWDAAYKAVEKAATLLSRASSRLISNH